MKKTLFLIAIVLFSIFLASCKPKVDPAEAKLEAAYDNLSVLISDPSNITGGFEVPTSLASGVTLTWTSSNPGVITIGTPSNGFAVVTVNRPAFGDDDAEVTLSVVLSIASELKDDKSLTKNWSINLTVKANTVEEIVIDSIADILAITDPAYDNAYEVSLTNLTIIAKGSDASFAYDGTGIIMVYGGSQENLEVGKVYNINATIDWYFGIWELTKWTAVLQASATPQMPTQETIASIDDKIDDLIEDGEHLYSGQNASAGNFEAIYASVTGKIYIVPGDTGSYNTYIVDVDYDTTQDWVPGSAGVPARGFMFYYNTLDFATIRLYAGIQVTIDVIIYTYRSNNQAFAIYYVGGPEGIDATLTDAQKLSIDAGLVNVPAVFEESATFDFATTGANGTTIAWTSSKTDVINVTTGVITAPAEGGVQVEITATISIGELVPVVKTFLVTVGEFEVTDIADLYDQVAYPLGTTVRIQGIYTGGHSSFYFIQDATGGVGLWPTSSPSQLRTDMGALAFGVKLDVIGTVKGYDRGYLEIEINKLENLKVIDSTPALPAAVAIDAITPFNLTGLVDYRSERVDLSGMVITSKAKSSFGTFTFMFVNPITGVQLDGVFDNRSNQYAASLDALEALKVGDVVDIKGAVLAASGGNPRLQFHYNGQIVISATTYTEQQLVDGAKNKLTGLPTENQEITDNITLPTTGLFGATVAWTSSNTDVIAANGTVTRPAAGQDDATITLSYIVTVGAASTTAVEIVVIVKAMPQEIPTTASELFISEYIEGAPGNRKAIEIYNGTGATVNLSAYRIKIGANGAQFNTEETNGFGLGNVDLSHGQTYVIYNDDSTNNDKLGPYGDVEWTGLNFNGDDAIGLFKNNVLIDVFGTPGIDPGSGWTINDFANATVDSVIIRNANVMGPKTVWDPSEWTRVGAYVDGTSGQDTLGKHTFTPGS